MALLIRGDHAEHVIRSVGDPPNGILTIACPEEGPTFYISPSFDPTRHAAGEAIVMQTDEGIPMDGWPITIGETVAGCEGPEELRSLWTFACMMAKVIVDALPEYPLRADDLIRVAVWIRDVRERLHREFHERGA